MKNMSKKKRIVLIVCGVILVILLGITIFLAQNKTFFKTKYINPSNNEIFVPRFSYFKEDSKNILKLNSIKSKKALDKEIGNYLETLSYFVDTETSGYKKDDLIIYSYTVEDKGWYRQILVTYN